MTVVVSKKLIDQPVKYNLEGPWEILPIIADFRTARSRYVRVKAKNAGLSPTGEITAVALDEVVVD